MNSITTTSFGVDKVEPLLWLEKKLGWLDVRLEFQGKATLAISERLPSSSGRVPLCSYADVLTRWELPAERKLPWFVGGSWSSHRVKKSRIFHLFSGYLQHYNTNVKMLFLVEIISINSWLLDFLTGITDHPQITRLSRNEVATAILWVCWRYG